MLCFHSLLFWILNIHQYHPQVFILILRMRHKISEFSQNKENRFIIFFREGTHVDWSLPVQTQGRSSAPLTNWRRVVVEQSGYRTVSWSNQILNSSTKCVYLMLVVSFRRHTNIYWCLLCGFYAMGSKRSHFGKWKSLWSTHWAVASFSKKPFRKIIKEICWLYKARKIKIVNVVNIYLESAGQFNHCKCLGNEVLLYLRSSTT